MKYEQEYKALHEKNKFKSWSSNYDDKHIMQLRGAVLATGSKTVLDYGCGKANQWHEGKLHNKLELKMDNVVLYDPGVPEYSTLPDKSVDCTISFDVMEHIPKEELPETLSYIFSHTKKFCFFVIHCGLAVKTFPNGDNVHCTIMNGHDWKKFIEPFNKNKIPVVYSFKVPLDPKYNILNL